MRGPKKNVPASVRARLLILAKERQEDFTRTLVRYGIERLLYRMSRHVSAARFILKGAMLFSTWPTGMHRSTGDLDLLAHGSSHATELKAVFSEICQEPGTEEDGIVFDPGSVSVLPLREEEKYQGARLTLSAGLDGAKIQIQVDLGFGDAVYPAPKKIIFPCLIRDMSQPEILAYPAETVIAEKFEAIVQLGPANGRLKDYSDIWAITRTFPFEMATLVEALKGTFTRRETALPVEIPFGLSSEFATLEQKARIWDAFLRRSPPAIEPPALEEVLADLRRFFLPVLRAAARNDITIGNWHPRGVWSE